MPAAYAAEFILLEENGYLVLRFLAEDLGKELDAVLDAILRSLNSGRRPNAATHRLTVDLDGIPRI